MANTEISSISKWKQNFEDSYLHSSAISITEHCDFFETWFFSLRLPSLSSKRLLVFFFCLLVCINTTGTEINYIQFIYIYILLEFLQGTFRLSFSEPFKAQKSSPTTAMQLCLLYLYSSSPGGSQSALSLLRCHRSGKQPLFFIWKTVVNWMNNKVSGHFPSGLLLASKVNLVSQGFLVITRVQACVL